MRPSLEGRTRAPYAAAAASAIALASSGVLAPAAGAAPGCTITGSNGPNVIVGTPGSDFICAYGGNDVIRGLGGNDRILGGGGADRVYGGGGDDRILGGPHGPSILLPSPISIMQRRICRSTTKQRLVSGQIQPQAIPLL